MSTIVHFDISADDPERAKYFYETLFGWNIQKLPDPINYYLIETKDQSGGIGVGGGIAKRDTSEQNGIVNYIGVLSIDDIMKKVISMGGKVVQPKQAIPGWGWLAVCTDTENNHFGLFQEDKGAHA